MTTLAGAAIAVGVFAGVCVLALVLLAVFDTMIRPAVRGIYDEDEGA